MKNAVFWDVTHNKPENGILDESSFHRTLSDAIIT
jgi:hypothetical protein